MARLLTANNGINKHLLFVGYRGCGKSTELKQLENEITDDFLVFNFSVFQELDPSNLNYIELIVVTMEQLFTFIEKENIDISSDYLKNISSFLKTKEITDIKERYMDISMDSGTETQFGVPYIQKFFIKLKASLKGSRSIKTILTEKVEPHFSTLLNHCNDLINEIRLKLTTLGKKDLVIIIEDLDKIKLSEARNLFFVYANQVISLKANVIYTFPIALYYDVNFNIIKNYFTKTYELPMIKVHEKDGREYEEGIKALKEIVLARMELKLFKDVNILNDFIHYSGGCLRDLFSMITEAAESSQDNNRSHINVEDKEYAIKKIKKEYKNTIADHINDHGDVDIHASDYYDVLIKLNKDPSKNLDNSIKSMHLRQNLTILGYNGEGWCDVHPIVKDILRERE